MPRAGVKACRDGSSRRTGLTMPGFGAGHSMLCPYGSDRATIAEHSILLSQPQLHTCS